MKIVCPIYLKQKYKKKKDKNISLNMNWYRNVHFLVNNKIKKEFKKILKKQIKGKKINTPIRTEYRLYWKRMSDLDNWQAVVSKYLQDALVEYGVIEDDNFNFIKENNYKVIEQDKENPRFEVTLITI